MRCYMHRYTTPLWHKITVTATAPSTMLHLGSERLHCFGCGAQGDVVQWGRSTYGVVGRETPNSFAISATVWAR